jgi:4-hydroxy-tetrahydrodipicolinate synthase
MVTDALTGAFAPVVTPFKPDGSADLERYIAHCRWLLAQGAGLAPFGTNSEANSIPPAERMALLEALVEAGLPAARLLPGTGACSAQESAELTRHAVQLGCAGVLMLPPFFYKGVTDEGLYAYYAEVIARVADTRLRLYLYHIPALSGVPITHAVIERLLHDFPGIVVGIKDSSGDWDNLAAMLQRFPQLAVFPASESLISRSRPLGARGCISATVNINPAAISRLVEVWDGPQGAELQARVDKVRQVVQARPMIAALKEVLAQGLNDPAWRRVRPPLVPLAPEAAEALLAELGAVGFRLHPAP